MTSTAHTLVAGAIASKFVDPATAAGLAFVAHYIMDSVPHWDWGTNWRTRPKRITAVLAVSETIFGIGITWYLFAAGTIPTTLAVTIAASLLPDWLETPWYIFFARQKKTEPAARASIWETLSYRIYKYQNFFHTKAQFPIGLLTQVVTVAFFVVALQ